MNKIMRIKEIVKLRELAVVGVRKLFGFLV